MKSKSSSLIKGIENYYNKSKSVNSIQIQEVDVDGVLTTIKKESSIVEVLNDSNYQQMIMSNLEILVICVASWCYRSKSVLDNLVPNTTSSLKYPNLKVLYLDYDSNPESILNLGGYKRPGAFTLIHRRNIKTTEYFKDYEEMLRLLENSYFNYVQQ